jgi:predicted DNA-binding transcriptional regulator AlpA
MDKFYSAEEIIGLLGISRKTLDNWIKEGHFPKPIKIGRRIFWRKEIVDNYILELENKNNS